MENINDLIAQINNYKLDLLASVKHITTFKGKNWRQDLFKQNGVQLSLEKEYVHLNYLN